MTDHFGTISINPAGPRNSTNRIKRRPSPPEQKQPAPEQPEQPRQKPQGKKHRGKKPLKLWLLATIGAAGIGVAYLLGAYLGIPYYFTHTAPENFNEKTGMFLECKHASFNPLTFRLTLEDLLFSDSENFRIGSIKSLDASLSPFSLLRTDFVSDSLRIAQADFEIKRNKSGNYNFSGFFSRDTQENIAQKGNLMDFSSLPFFFSLNNIEVRNSRIVFHDYPAGKTHTMEEISLDLPTIANIPHTARLYLQPHFSAVIDGSPVEVSGETRNHDGGGTRLSLDVQSFSLADYVSYLPFQLPVQFIGGKASGNVELSFSPAPGNSSTRLNIHFSLNIDGSELADEKKNFSMVIPQGQIKGMLQPIDKTINFEEILLRKPLVTLSGNSILTALDQIAASPAVNADQTPAPEIKQPYTFKLASLIVEGGSLQKQAPTEKTPALLWENIQLTAMNYSSNETGQEQQGTFRVTGERQKEKGYFSWQGSITSPSRFAGAVELTKMNGSDFIGSFVEEPALPLSGTIDCKGTLTFKVKPGGDEKSSFAITNGAVTINNLSVKDKQGVVIEAPQATFEGFKAIQGNIDLGAAQITGGILRLPAGREPKFGKEFTDGQFHLSSLSFEGKTELLTGRERDKSLLFETLAIAAGNLKNTGDSSRNLKISAKTAAGGSVTAEGALQLRPFKFAGTTSFGRLDAASVFGMFGESALLSTIRSKMSGSGKFSLPEKTFTGDLQLTEGSRGTGAKASSWKELSVKQVEFTAMPFHLAVRDINCASPQLVWERKSSEDTFLNTISNFFRENLPTVIVKGQSKKSRPALASVEIKNLNVNSGTVTINDKSMSPAWSGVAANIAGTLSNVHTSENDKNSGIRMTGQLNESSFSVEGDINFFRYTTSSQLAYRLDNFPMAALKKQLAEHIDLNPEKGIINALMKQTWAPDGYKETATIQMQNTEPLDVESDTALIVALLGDQNRNFTMELQNTTPDNVNPVTLFDEAISQFQTLVIKAGVSPLLLASGDFSDLIDNNYIEFAPGEFVLSEEGQKTLNRYVTLLKVHPMLGLRLTGGVDPQTDSATMKSQLEAVENRRVTAENEKRRKEWESRNAEYTQKIAEQKKQAEETNEVKETSIPSELLKKIVLVQPVPVTIDQKMLVELADNRQDVLYQYFNSQLPEDSARIEKIAVPKITGKTLPGHGVHIELIAVKQSAAGQNAQ